MKETVTQMTVDMPILIIRTEKNMKVNATLNPNKSLRNFEPIDGSFFCHDTPSLNLERLNEESDDVFKAIKEAVNSEFDLRIEIFRPDGTACNGQMPHEGTFLVTRSQRGEAWIF